MWTRRAIPIAAGSDGIHILNPGGERLSIVVHEEPATTNVCIGDSGWKSVLSTTREEARLLQQRFDYSMVT